MFVRNLRQRLLASPIRGSVIMGVDPGFTHGCKIAILSPTSKWIFSCYHLFCVVLLVLCCQAVSKDMHVTVVSCVPNSNFTVVIEFTFGDKL